MGDKNCIFMKSLHKNFVSGFIDSLARRAPKFNEVNEAAFLLELQLTRSRSDKLAENGIPLEWLFDQGFRHQAGFAREDRVLESDRLPGQSGFLSDDD
jgi:hypothetical protein